ncbi:hypothetical protein Cgig2_026688 [Carnegiea gigantea]|uniref:Protein arginine N-methyltransferase domain-containing protein n=1 Tax=Carnegiea gigantea TaxID=171969 RepID=A0A9Q1GKU8_9CARY|nr:hypothetical protein Cgig2_026688 [Carnegiea gigantea]
MWHCFRRTGRSVIYSPLVCPVSAMVPLAKQCAFEEPSVETISGENVLTWPHVVSHFCGLSPISYLFSKVKHINCYTVIAAELETVATKFKLQSMMRAPLHGFAFWFDVEFGGPVDVPNDNAATSSQSTAMNSDCTHVTQRKRRVNPSDALVLSTAPEDPPTHWQQVFSPPPLF